MIQQFDVIYIPLGTATLGGAERSLLELAGEMRRLDRRCVVLCERALEGTDFPGLVAEQGVALHWVDWGPERSLIYNLRAALATWRRFSAPLIHFNMSWRRGMWVIVVAARLVTRARVVATMRAMPDPASTVPRKKYFGIIKGVQLWHLPDIFVGRLWARLAHVTVSVNRDDYPRRLAVDYGYSPDRMRVIYNGVRIRPPTSAVRHPHPEVRVCYVGRMTEEKGIQYLLRAMHQLPERYRLTLLGEGPYLSYCESLASDLGLSSRAKFAGFVRDPQQDLQMADVVVVPSVWEEAFGRVVIEAMGLGVPVIATRVGGMAEIFADGIEGIYVRPRDVAGLVAALKRLGDDPALRERIGAAARLRVLDQFTVERAARQYAELYDELLGHSIPGGDAGATT